MNEVTYIVAFLGGIVSFLSPCVLPIVPGFLAYLSGTTTTGVATTAKRTQSLWHAAMFVLGFSVVFAILGTLLNAVLSVDSGYVVRLWLSRIGGAVVIAFGLYLAKVISIPFLDREIKFRVPGNISSKSLTSILFGAAFAAGWTPCVGAALGAILAIATTQPGTALALLFSYGLGLGVPFLIVGFFFDRADALIRRIGPALPLVNRIFGYILVALGVLVFTQQLSRIANFELLNKLLLL